MNLSRATKQRQQTLRACIFEPLTKADGELLAIKFLYTIQDKPIAVMVSYDAPPGYDQRDTSVPARYLDRYDEAGWWSDGAKDSTNAEKRLDALTDEMQEVIHDTCHETLIELGGPPLPACLPGETVKSGGAKSNEDESIPSTSPLQTLHEYMYPQSFVLHLVSQKGELMGIRRDDVPPPARWPANSNIAALESEAQTRVPIYTPSQIQVLKTFLFHSGVLLVATPGGHDLCCKLSAGHVGSFEREYNALRKIRDAGCTTGTLRVPQLRGLICNEVGHGEDGIVGILMDHIDTECYELTFHLAPALPSADTQRHGDHSDDGKGRNIDNHLIDSNPIPDIEPSRREKWCLQIQSIVNQLHAVDVVWGDVKTANILLDRNDDLWVVDFGGGATRGWIDRELIETKEGDLQGLKRILEEIGGERRVWRSDMRPPTDPELV